MISLFLLLAFTDLSPYICAFASYKAEINNPSAFLLKVSEELMLEASFGRNCVRKLKTEISIWKLMHSSPIIRRCSPTTGIVTDFKVFPLLWLK